MAEIEDRGGQPPSGGARAGMGGDSGGRSSRDAAEAGFLHIYKPGQGSYVRWGSAAGAGLVALAFAGFLSQQMPVITSNEIVQTLVSVAALVALGIWIFRLIGQKRRVVDFLIATEGEMKKVNWSTRREISGSTKVVIFVVLVLGFILFVVDIIFMAFFGGIGVLRIGLAERLFGTGAQ